MSNKAAYITEAKANPLQVKEASMPKAGKGEVVVKNAAAAVNPVDCKCSQSSRERRELTISRENSGLWYVPALSGSNAQLLI
jgi:NADPH:quinone reductase-like Zn-dependent oxidoreductase